MRQDDKRNMSPQDALTACGESEGLEDIARFWDESAAAMPGGLPCFLEESQWRACREWTGFAPGMDAILRRTVDKIAQSPALRRLAWHGYWRVFLAPDACPPTGWPDFTAALGDDGGVFYLLIGLGFIPLVRQWHAKLGIPEDITRETVSAARCCCDDTHRNARNGLPGMLQGQLGWMRHYTRERYFRIGRLEYWLAPYTWTEQVFRNRHTGEVVALAAHGTRFSAEGRVFGDAGNYRNGDGWTASFERPQTHVTGHLLHPNGYGTTHKVTLSLDDWECLLEKGVTTLQMHIPFGGHMPPDACRDSVTRAKALFARHFPDEPAVAITCGSWIFSPQLQACLPDTSNLVRFQRELFLVPSPAHGSDGLWFVFLERGLPDFRTWPRKTRVQRAILDYLEQGHVWGAGRMFFLLDDVPRFGQQVYRAAWPPSALSS